MKITEYMIVEESNDEAFINRVNDFIKDGWTPLGGVSLTIVDSIRVVNYCQALVKYSG